MIVRDQHHVIDRRSFIGGSIVAGAAIWSATVKAGGAATDEVIDFRVRPPFRSMRRIFHAKLDVRIPDKALMEQFLADMAAAGIHRAVAMGRSAAEGFLKADIPNEDIAALVTSYPDRFIGFGSVDVRDPARAKAEIEHCKALGFKGVAFDNPASSPPLYDDDASLMPIYEHCHKHGLIVSLTSSGMVGPDLSYSMPIHIQKVGHAFPQLPIVVPHGAWPWTTEAVSLMMEGAFFKRSQIYLMPDFYLSQPHAPGRQDYIDAANFGLDGRLLFASSFPALPLKKSVEELRAIPFADPRSATRILGGNAAKLLGLTA